MAKFSFHVWESGYFHEKNMKTQKQETAFKAPRENKSRSWPISVFSTCAVHPRGIRFFLQMAVAGTDAVMNRAKMSNVGNSGTTALQWTVSMGAYSIEDSLESNQIAETRPWGDGSYKTIVVVLAGLVKASLAASRTLQLYHCSLVAASTESIEVVL